MAGFNLTAQINLQGPGNVKKVVAGIQKQLNGLKADVNLNINPATVKTLQSANKKLIAINASLNKVSSTATRATSAVSQFAKTINSIGTGNVAVKVQAVSKATQQLGKNSAITFKNLKIARGEIEEFGRQSALAIRRFTAFASVTSVIYGVNNAINTALSDFVKFDRQLVRIAQVSGQTVSNLKGLQGTIGELATGIGVSSSSLAEISVTLTQAGFSIRDVQKALKALALTDVAPTFNNLNDTVEGSIALLRQFSINAGQLEGALGSINAVAARFAVESSDIIAAIQRAGGVFAAASRGVSEGTDALNQFIAVFTSVRATTREGAETIATGLRTIFTRLQRETTIDALKEFGVNLQDAEGKFVGAFKAVKLLSEGLGSLDPRDIRFSKIVEELGGFRQIGKVIPLIGQFATAQEALKVAQQGQGSLADSNAKAQQALAVQFAKVREEFLKLVRDVAGTSSFKSLISGALSLASALIKVADAVKGIIPILGLLTAARGASAIGQFAKGFGGGLKRTQGFARGGTVPGSGNTDSVPAMLTPGEFVLRKSSAKALGTEKLHRMNKFGQGGIAKATVQKVIDGDTINIDVVPTGKSFNTSATRLAGYDAYELYKGNKKERDLGAKGKALAANYYPKGKDVTKLFNTKAALAAAGTEKYNRYMYTDTKFGNMLIAQGLGVPYTGSGEKATKGKRRKPRTKKSALGGSVQDTVPAMLTPGEFVVNAKSAKAVGYGNLRKMNTRPQGFNKGGVVGFNRGGLTVSGQSGNFTLSKSSVDILRQLEINLDSMGQTADQLKKTLTTKGTVDNKQLQASIKQVKANLRLAKSSAATSADMQKVIKLEKDLRTVRTEAAKRGRGQSSASKIGEAITGEAGFYAAAALATLSAAADSTGTALGSGLAGAASSLATTIALVQGVSATIPVVWGAIAAVSPGVAAGLAGMLVPLLPFAVGAAAVVAALALLGAGIFAYNSYVKKQIELAKKAAQTKLDTATDKAAQAMEKFSKSASDINFQEVNKAIADQISAGRDLGTATGAQVANEAQATTGVYGTLRELSATLTGGFIDSIEDVTNNNKDRVTAAAKELVDANSEAFKNAQNVVFQQFAKGQTLDSLKAAAPGSEEAKALDNLIDSALAADKTYQEQAMRAKQQGRTLSTAALNANRERVKNDLLAADSAIALKDKTEQAARAQEALNRLQVKLATSFARLNTVVQQSINRIDLENSARQDSLNSIIARAKGEASVPEIRSRAANVVENPNAYTGEERNATRRRLASNLTPALGRQQAGEVAAISTFDPAIIEKSFTDAANKLSPGTPTSTVTAEIRSNIKGLADELRAAGAVNAADNLQQQADATAAAVAGKLTGSEGRDPNKRRAVIDEALANLRKGFDETRDKAVELAKSFSEARVNALNQFAKNLQEAAKLQNEALKYEQAAIDAQNAASDSILKALTGFGPSVQELIQREAQNTAALTGGPTDPAGIAENMQRLSTRAKELEEGLGKASNSAENLSDMQVELIQVNTELSNNRSALEKLAESASAAAEAALAEVNDRKRLQEANRKFAETLVSSGPDELRAMDEALVRANQRLNGFIPQAGANERKRFFELLKQTGSVRQASQGVAAETRGKDLKFLQDTRDVRQKRLEQTLGSAQAARDEIARQESAILGQMGSEAGLGALGQDILNQATQEIADPTSDPVMQNLINTYNNAAATQIEANKELAKIASGAANEALILSQDNLKASIDTLNANIAGGEGRTAPANRRADAQNPARRTQALAAGGSVFRPQGTDTVPAMLTPGEFVVNRKAAQKNMGLLQSINGGKVTGYSNGGKVLYLRGGGFAQRDTNKDGVITIGTEDASGLNDTNNDGVITFAEFMANQSLTDPKAKDYINKMSNNMARYNKNISPLNVLRNEQYYDNLELFGPINSELGDYIEDGFKGDLEAFKAAKNDNQKINEEIKKLNNGKDIEGNKVPFNDNPKLKRINELLAKREKNREVLGDIGGNRNFALARDKDFRDGVTIGEIMERREKDIAQAINQGMNPEEAASKVDADYVKTFDFTPQQAGLYNRMVARDQTIQGVQGGGGGITSVKAGHRKGSQAARSQYLKDRRALINQGMDPMLASQEAMKDYPQNYTNARDKYWEDRATRIKEKQGEQQEKPMGPVNPIMGMLAMKNKDVQAEQNNAAKEAMNIEKEVAQKEAAEKKAKNDKIVAQQKADARETARIEQKERQAAAERIKKAEAENKRRGENASIRRNVDEQKNILDDKIASKEAEIRSNQQLHDQEGWFDWTYNQVIGDDTRNYELKRKILDQELAHLKMAREGTQKVIDSGYDRKVLGENYTYAASKSGHKFDFTKFDEQPRGQTQRTMTGSERLGVYTQAENQQMYDSTMQGIQATKRTVEAAIQAAGAIFTVGASSLFSGTGAASANILSKVPVLGQMLTRSTLGSSMASGAFTGGVTSVAEEAAGVSESKSLTESVGNVMLDTIIGGFASGVGHIAADMFGRMSTSARKAMKGAKPKPGVDGEGLMTGTRIDPNAPLPDTLDPSKIAAQNAPNNFDPSTVKSDLNAGAINPNYRPKPGDLNYEPPTVTVRTKDGKIRKVPTAELSPEQQLNQSKIDAILAGDETMRQAGSAPGVTVSANQNPVTLPQRQTVNAGPGDRLLTRKMTAARPDEVGDQSLVGYSYRENVRNSLTAGAGYAGLGGEQVVEGATAASPVLSTLNALKTVASMPQDIADTVNAFENVDVDELLKKGSNIPVQRKSRGGPIYANNGALIPFQSRGTDTVPAMLTPGEFVVNRNSTSKFLPVLRAINNGYSSHNNMVNHLAKGGVAGQPQYLQNGGLAGGATNNGVSVNSQIQGLEEFKTMVAQLNQAISGGTENMNSVVTQITQASNSFSATAQSVNEAATNIPDSVAVAQNVRVDGIPDTLSGFSDNLLNSSVAQSTESTNRQFNDLNTKNEGSLGLPSPNNSAFIA